MMGTFFLSIPFFTSLPSCADSSSLYFALGPSSCQTGTRTLDNKLFFHLGQGAHYMENESPYWSNGIDAIDQAEEMTQR